MEPMLPEPNLHGESATPVPPEGAQAIERAAEKSVEAPGGIQPIQSMPPLPVAQPAPAPLPTAPAHAQPLTGDPASAAAPLIADDVDVIEKEWVDKAKKIVSATKEDPHKQENEVSKLQADYLMKRYNKKLKVTE